MTHKLGRDCIRMELFRSNAVLFKQLVGHQGTGRTVCSAGKLYTVHDRNVFHSLVGDVLQHLFIGLYRNHLHDEIVLHSLVVRDL